MSMVSIGDLSQHYVSQRNGGRIKGDLARLGAELSTGRVADLNRSLAGNTKELSGIQHTLAVAQAHSATTNQVSLTLASMQRVLGEAGSLTSDLASALVVVNATSPTHQISEASRRSFDEFSDLVSTFNSTWAGKSLFAGTAVDQTALPPADAMLSDIVATIPDPGDPSSVISAVTAWFEDPAGGFMSTAYGGNLTAQETRIGRDEIVNLDVTAADPAVLKALSSTALGAVVNQLETTLSRAAQGEILRESGVQLISSSQGIASLQARLGHQEERVESVKTSLSSMQSALGIALNDMTLADPFETATKLEATQRQLELHFTATARLSRLTLADYI